jgi:hypothetical protein
MQEINKINFQNAKECWRFVYDKTKQVIDSLPDSNMKTKKWLQKKAITHVAEVIKVADQMIANSDYMNSVDMKPRKAFARLTTIAIFHDLGRASEVDTQTGELKKGFDHALASYEMIKEAGIKDPDILIPVKYHGCLNLEEALKNDAEYQNLSDDEKKIVLSFSQIIRDADKIANLEEKANYGFKGSLEERDPNLSDKYEISPEVDKSIRARQQVNNKDRKTRVDAMLRIAGWIFDLNTPFAKQYIRTNKVVERIFGQVDNLMQTARQKAVEEGTFDQKKYDETSEKLKILQNNYVSDSRIELKIQRSNRLYA